MVCASTSTGTHLRSDRKTVTIHLDIAPPYSQISCGETSRIVCR